MRKLLALPLIAVIACGSEAFKDQARNAMPTKDTVAMGSPQSQQPTSMSGQDTVTQNEAIGSSASFSGLTVELAVAFNLPVAVFLDLVKHVTEDFEPTSCDATSCTWGPGHGPFDFNDFKLVVTKDGGDFDWELSGRPIGATGDFIVFAAGKATPGPQPHHGSGSFTVDFDKAATLAGPHDGTTGELIVSNYSNVGPAQLAVQFIGARDTDPTHPAGQKNNVAYQYANNNTGGGDLQIAVKNTVPGNGDNFSVHSQWKNDGRGRADVEGQGGGVAVQLSECWSAAPFLVQYFQSTITLNLPPFGGPAQGDNSACAYPGDPSYSTLTAP